MVNQKSYFMQVHTVFVYCWRLECIILRAWWAHSDHFFTAISAGHVLSMPGNRFLLVAVSSLLVNHIDFAMYAIDFSADQPKAITESLLLM